MKKELILELLKNYPSFYLYDEKIINERIDTLKAKFPKAQFLYSVKCNPDKNVLKTIFNKGFGVDAASLGEVLIAKDMGLAKNQIYYSAPGKSYEDIKEAIDKSVIIADSLGEIKRINEISKSLEKVTSIGVRLNPSFGFGGGQAGPSKFGIDEEAFFRMMEEKNFDNVKITGLHVHLKSQELDAEKIAEYHNNVFELAHRFKGICGCLEYLNVGSGLGITYNKADIPVNVDLVSQNFGKLAEMLDADTKLFIETGRYIVGKSGIYATTVLDRKETRGKTFIILRSTLNGFVRPALSRMVEGYSPEEYPAPCEPMYTCKDAFEIIPLSQEEPSEKVTLSGNLCTAQDVIAEDIMMPHLEYGDGVVITNAGSYAAVITPMQFSSQEKPAELFLREDGKVIQ